MNYSPVTTILENRQRQIGRIFNFDLNREPIYIFDLSKNNQGLKKIDFNQGRNFPDYIAGTLKKNYCQIGLGRYNEDRIIYRDNIFQTGKDRRTVHLGIDIWLAAGTEILAPLAGRIHSFADNRQRGDYGPTVILEHLISGRKFFTLYGHLSRKSLRHLVSGQNVRRGQVISQTGSRSVNGGWPPHLHFQIIKDMLGRRGDFYGVSSRRERRYYLKLCPDPNLILKIDSLRRLTTGRQGV